MKFPSGRLWQAFLAFALDMLPADTRSMDKGWNLTSWRESGEAIVLAPPRPYALLLQASPYSFASALLNEVQSLLDHAAEHRALVQVNVAANNDCSPSWLFVTTYYWSLFGALAFIRLLGRAAWYLDKQALKALVAGTGLKAPTSGTYVLHVGAIQGSARRDFYLKQSDERFHEATWKLVTELIRPHLDAVTASTTSANAAQMSEIAIFRCLADDPFRAPNWPSSLRNSVNYKPGFTYQSVHGVDLIEIYTFFRKLNVEDWGSLSDKYSSLARDVMPGSEPQTYLATAAKMLSLKALIFEELTTSLLNEVIAERRLDRRWASTRDRYLRSRTSSDANSVWPFLAA